MVLIFFMPLCASKTYREFFENLTTSKSTMCSMADDMIFLAPGEFFLGFASLLSQVI